MKKSSWLIYGSIVLSFVGYLLQDNGIESVGQFLLVIPLFTMLPIGISQHKKEKKAEYDALSPEEKAKVDAQQEAAQQELARLNEQMAQQKAERAQGKTIVSTAIVDSTGKSKTKASATSSVVRGAVGGAVFGPVGMIAGAVTPKKNTITKTKDVTFAILYANGKRDLEKVKVGSKRYNELAKYLA